MQMADFDRALKLISEKLDELYLCGDIEKSMGINAKTEAIGSFSTGLAETTTA